MLSILAAVGGLSRPRSGRGRVCAWLVCISCRVRVVHASVQQAGALTTRTRFEGDCIVPVEVEGTGLLRKTWLGEVKVAWCAPVRGSICALSSGSRLLSCVGAVENVGEAVVRSME